MLRLTPEISAAARAVTPPAEILDQFFLNTPPKAAPPTISNHMTYIAFLSYLCQPLDIYRALAPRNVIGALHLFDGTVDGIADQLLVAFFAGT